MRKEKVLFIDPRTKVFLLLIMNIILLSMNSGPVFDQLRFFFGLLPFILLLTISRFWMAFVYLCLYFGGYFLDAFIVEKTSGFLMMLTGFLSSIATRFLPGGMIGAYFILSTQVNEFVCAMERIHVSHKIIIPISVMFRFFPTVAEESKGISDAMRMRKLGFGHLFTKPEEILEYRMVPLLISVVKIGEELSASALTRCLGMNKKRSSISRCGFGIADYCLSLVGIIFATLYFLALGGVI